MDDVYLWTHGGRRTEEYVMIYLLVSYVWHCMPCAVSMLYLLAMDDDLSVIEYSLLLLSSLILVTWELVSYDLQLTSYGMTGTVVLCIHE